MKKWFWSFIGAPLFRGAPFLSVALVCLSLVLSFHISPAYAHKVNMFAYVEGNKVMMEGYFSDGNKPMNCDVTVTDSNGKMLLKGLTDKEGKFSFNIPEITDLHVVLNAGMGHRAQYVISRAELMGAQPNAGGDQASSASKPEETAANAKETTDTSAPTNLDEAMVRKAVTDAIVPLMRTVDQMRESANFSNIVGGIGFIFGIVGVFFYIKARQILAKSSQPSAGN
jgi:nickel transport protein